MKTLGLRDIIGPVMVGPSSSHTAGALAIAKMARNLCAQPPARVTFTLYGSFAHTGSGHGTDKALVAGMLGFDACDLEIRDSFSIARDRGLDVEFVRETRRDAEHPNTVDIVMEEPDATRLEVRGVSVGGGAAVITCTPSRSPARKAVCSCHAKARKWACSMVNVKENIMCGTKIFGKRIFQMWRKDGLSQKQLGDVVGLSHQGNQHQRIV